MTHHIVPVKNYVLIWAALIFLTFMTTLVNGIDLGEWNTVVALGIAVCKATLVILFFMHVKQSSALTKLFVVAGFFWLLIMISYTLSDYWSRAWLPGARWQ